MAGGYDAAAAGVEGVAFPPARRETKYRKSSRAKEAKKQCAASPDCGHFSEDKKACAVKSPPFDVDGLLSAIATARVNLDLWDATLEKSKPRIFAHEYAVVSYYLEHYNAHLNRLCNLVNERRYGDVVRQQRLFLFSFIEDRAKSPKQTRYTRRLLKGRVSAGGLFQGFVEREFNTRLEINTIVMSNLP